MIDEMKNAYRSIVQALNENGIEVWYRASVYGEKNKITNEATLDKSLSNYQGRTLLDIIENSENAWTGKLDFSLKDSCKDIAMNPLLRLHNPISDKEIYSLIQPPPIGNLYYHTLSPLRFGSHGNDVKAQLNPLVMALVSYERAAALSQKFNRDLKDELILEIVREEAAKLKDILIKVTTEMMPTEKYSKALKNFIEDYEQTVLFPNEKYNFIDRRVRCCNNRGIRVNFASRSARQKCERSIDPAIQSFMLNDDDCLVMEASWHFADTITENKYKDLIPLTSKFLKSKNAKNVSFSMTNNTSGHDLAFGKSANCLKMKFGLTLKDLGKDENAIEAFIPDEMMA